MFRSKLSVRYRDESTEDVWSPLCTDRAFGSTGGVGQKSRVNYIRGGTWVDQFDLWTSVSSEEKKSTRSG